MSIADEIRKLAVLRDEGILSEEEFQVQKSTLVGSREPAIASRHEEISKNDPPNFAPEWASLPVSKKWWFQALLTLLIIPVGLILMAAQKSHFKKRDGSVAKRSLVTKLMFGLLAVSVWAFNIFALTENGVVWVTANPKLSQCDSNLAKVALTDAIENNANANLQTLRLLDLTEIESISYDADSQTRTCNANFVLNSGTERLGYKMHTSSDGFLLVEIVEQYAELGDPLLAEIFGDETLSETIEPTSSSLDSDNHPDLDHGDLEVGGVSDLHPNQIAQAAAELYTSEMFPGANCCEATITENPVLSEVYSCDTLSPVFDSQTFYPAYQFNANICGRESCSEETVAICVPHTASSLAQVVIQFEDGFILKERDLSEEYESRNSR